MENFLRDSVDLRGISNRTIAGDAHFFDDATSPDKIRQYLESTKESEKLKGMKWLLAMMSKGRDVAEFFPDVVKNVVVKSVEVKKMVYIYLVHYADFNSTCREIALLSINSFQKDMAGTNQLIRGLALRVMTSIRVPDIIQIQLLAVRKCATDSSPYVRRCAATALTKIYAFDESQINHLKQILEKLLKDASTMVLGSAIAAFNEICPTSYEVLHRVYRKICHLLADMDEWTQVPVLEVMTRYVRNQFTDPAPGVAAAVRLRAKRRSTSAVKGRNTVKRRVVRKAFYSDEEDESEEEEVVVEVETRAEQGSVFGGGLAETEGDLDPDHRLILRSSQPLLKSRNSGVVLAVCTLHYYCGAQTGTVSTQIGKALVRILRNPREIQYVVLTCISAMAQERPTMFRPFLQDFFIKGTDPVFNRLLKLEILSAITTKDNLQGVLKECQTYVRHGNKSFVCATLRAVGRIADALPEIADRCMDGIMHLIYCNKTPDVMVEAVVVLRQILQQTGNTECGSRILHRLVKLLITEGGIEEPAARASIVWLVGEFHDILSAVAPDVLRLLASGFADEEPETRVQILNLAMKQSLRLSDDERVQSLMTYVLEMARYDPDTDIRDRARFVTAIMGLAPSGEGGVSGVDEDALEALSEHAKGIVLAPKLPPLTLLGPVDVEGLPNFTVGSLSSLVGHRAAGYDPIPAWPLTTPDLEVRDAHRYADDEDNAGVGGGVGKDKDAVKHKKYDDSSSSSSESDDSDNGKGKVPKNFYDNDSSNDDEDDDGSDSDDEEEEEDSENEASDEESEEEDESDDDESESEVEDSASDKSNDPEEDDDDEESEDEYATRIPLTKSKSGTAASNSATTARMVKVGSGSGSGSHSKPIGVVSSDTTFGLLGDFGHMKLLDPAPAMTTSHTSGSGGGGSSDPMMFFPPSAPAASSSLKPTTRTSDDDVMSQIMESFTTSSSGQTMGHNHSQQQQRGGGGGGSMSSSAAASGLLGLQYDYTSTQNQNQGMSKASTSSLSEVLSDVRQVVKPEIAGGLSVAVLFRHGAKPALLPGACCLFVVVRNCGDTPIRRINVSFPSDVKRTPMDAIAVLAPSEEIRMPVEMILSGRQPIKVDIRSDKGPFNGVLVIDPWTHMTPLALSAAEVRTARSSLGGFSETTATVTCAPGILTETTDITARIRRLLNVFPAQDESSGSGSASDGELLFAGSMRKASGMAEDRLILGLRPSDGNTMKIQVNCDDALVSTSLMDAVKKCFTTTASRSS
eukprot:gene6874-13937_t